MEACNKENISAYAAAHRLRVAGLPHVLSSAAHAAANIGATSSAPNTSFQPPTQQLTTSAGVPGGTASFLDASAATYTIDARSLRDEHFSNAYAAAHRSGDQRPRTAGFSAAYAAAPP